MSDAVELLLNNLSGDCSLEIRRLRAELEIGFSDSTEEVFSEDVLAANVALRIGVAISLARFESGSKTIFRKSSSFILPQIQKHHFQFF